MEKKKLTAQIEELQTQVASQTKLLTEKEDSLKKLQVHFHFHFLHCEYTFTFTFYTASIFSLSPFKLLVLSVSFLKLHLPFYFLFHYCGYNFPHIQREPAKPMAIGWLRETIGGLAG
jgi:hypothetical protein